MKKKKNFSTLFLLLLGIAALYGYFQIEIEPDNTLEQVDPEEKQKFQEKTNALQEEIDKLRRELKAVRESGVPEKKIVAAFGEKAHVLKKSEEISDIDIEKEILKFFSYLDKKDYIRSYSLKNGLADEFNSVVGELAKSHIDITEEMHSLYTMIKSASYLYRILGKPRLFLIKDILEKEAEIMESAMKTFFVWFNTGEKTVRLNRPSLKTQYEFASYLANSHGGRSYLLRRDSKTRILTFYYATLIIDRANDSRLNSNGIDVRPLIKSSLDEIENRLGLLYQDQYVKKLKELRKKYM